ncbi:kinase-like protein [Phaffia rhodozyma]|uniref:Kinase-like protein n=1 Tax=Phaffia rhodozyma TaxID=264483 RepID=A0A0F7SXN1_PHARH|nr:kinase-like protein [Phaffia rhodozyma]
MLDLKSMGFNFNYGSPVKPSASSTGVAVTATSSGSSSVAIASSSAHISQAGASRPLSPSSQSANPSYSRPNPISLSSSSPPDRLPIGSTVDSTPSLYGGSRTLAPNHTASTPLLSNLSSASVLGSGRPSGLTARTIGRVASVPYPSAGRDVKSSLDRDDHDDQSEPYPKASSVSPPSTLPRNLSPPPRMPHRTPSAKPSFRPPPAHTSSHEDRPLQTPSLTSRSLLSSASESTRRARLLGPPIRLTYEEAKLQREKAEKEEEEERLEREREASERERDPSRGDLGGVQEEDEGQSIADIDRQSFSTASTSTDPDRERKPLRFAKDLDLRERERTSGLSKSSTLPSQMTVPSMYTRTPPQLSGEPDKNRITPLSSSSTASTNHHNAPSPLSSASSLSFRLTSSSAMSSSTPPSGLNPSYSQPTDYQVLSSGDIQSNTDDSPSAAASASHRSTSTTSKQNHLYRSSGEELNRLKSSSPQLTSTSIQPSSDAHSTADMAHSSSSESNPNPYRQAQPNYTPVSLPGRQLYSPPIPPFHSSSENKENHLDLLGASSISSAPQDNPSNKRNTRSISDHYQAPTPPKVSTSLIEIDIPPQTNLRNNAPPGGNGQMGRYASGLGQTYQIPIGGPEDDSNRALYPSDNNPQRAATAPPGASHQHHLHQQQQPTHTHTPHAYSHPQHQHPHSHQPQASAPPSNMMLHGRANSGIASQGYYDTSMPIPGGSTSTIMQNGGTNTVMQHSQQQQYGQMGPPTLMQPGGTRQGMMPLPGEKKERYLEVNGRSYQKLCQIGRGGSSKVFKALNEKKDVVAIKKVALDRLDAEAIRNYQNEIDLLKKLRGHEKVIRLDDEETTRSGSGKPKAIFVVMEFGEADFSKLLEEQKGKRLNMNFVGFFWLQMLECVQIVHDHGIIHTDLKPANFVLVRGCLKIIDFGISHKIEGDTVHVRRDNQIGTVNYMSPESVQKSNGEPRIVLGKPTDVWALGCILYQMIYGHLPFSDFTNHPAKIAAICNPRHQIPYPTISVPRMPSSSTTSVLGPNASGSNSASIDTKTLASPVDPLAIEVMKACHMRDEKMRPTIGELIEHDFLKPWKRTLATNSSAPPVNKMDMLPPECTSISFNVLEQLVTFVRSKPTATAEDAFRKLKEVHAEYWANH